MKRYAYHWIQDWCLEHGWTDLFIERYCYWAFPPGAVMPQPIPNTVLQTIKRQKGLSPAEKVGYGLALATTGLAALVTYRSGCPFPLVIAFGVCALVLAYLDDE